MKRKQYSDKEIANRFKRLQKRLDFNIGNLSDETRRMMVEEARSHFIHSNDAFRTINWVLSMHRDEFRAGKLPNANALQQEVAARAKHMLNIDPEEIGLPDTLRTGTLHLNKSYESKLLAEDFGEGNIGYIRGE